MSQLGEDVKEELIRCISENLNFTGKQILKMAAEGWISECVSDNATKRKLQMANDKAMGLQESVVNDHGLSNNLKATQPIYRRRKSDE